MLSESNFLRRARSSDVFYAKINTYYSPRSLKILILIKSLRVFNLLSVRLCQQASTPRKSPSKVMIFTAAEKIAVMEAWLYVFQNLDCYEFFLASFEMTHTDVSGFLQKSLSPNLTKNVTSKTKWQYSVCSSRLRLRQNVEPRFLNRSLPCAFVLPWHVENAEARAALWNRPELF